MTARAGASAPSVGAVLGVTVWPPLAVLAVLAVGAGEGRGARLADVARLVVEVLDADPAQRPEPKPVPDDQIRPLVVDVDLERPPVTRDQHGFADGLEVVPDRVEVERAAPDGLEQEHRLVAEPLVGMRDQGRGLRSGGRAAPPGRDGRLSEEVEQRPLEQPVQPLPARVHDPGLAQDREEARGLRHGSLGPGQGRAEDCFDVVVVFRRRHGRRGRLADDREDRALDRLRDRPVCGPRALGQRMGEVQAVEPPLPAQPVGHTPEDLARDDARVAAGAHERPEADRGRDPVRRLSGDRFGLVQGRLDGGVHVRSGVAIGNGVHVQAVDLVDVRLEVGDGRPERFEQTVSVAGPTGHLGDVRAAVGEVARADTRRQGRGSRRDGTIGGHVEPIDVDDDAADLLPQRGVHRVPDRRVDLAGDFRDGDAQGDLEVELDLDAVVDPDHEARLAEPEAGKQPRDRAPGERADPVRPEGRGAHDVGDGATRDEGSAGCRTDGHAGWVLPARARSGAARAMVGRSTASEERPGACAIIPPRSGRTARAFHLTPSLRIRMARSCAICGKASMGGFNPQSSGMNRVRAHRRMQPNLQPLVIDVKGSPTKALVCTRCRRTLLKASQ